MNKIIRLGTTTEYGSPCSIFCNIKFIDGKLSITGVEGPTGNGNCRGGCGQIVISLNPDSINPTPGWTHELIEKFLLTWDMWHLNDLQAGSPAQRAHLATFKFDRTLHSDHYSWAKEVLTEAGLQPDPNYLHNDKPYSYGSAWLRKEVPADVIAFLESLPETDITPAWV